jgi:aryl-alcohol dehydrogenase-like predicted oxidoreductase
VPIFGAKHVRYVEENVGAVDITFSDEEQRALAEAAPRGIAAGLRYPANSIASVNR